MTKTYYLQKIISASNGPLMAEILADECSAHILKMREGKPNVFKKRSKSSQKNDMEHLELAITKIMRQAKDEANKDYQKVLDRIHVTGMDPLFKGPLPVSGFDKTNLDPDPAAPAPPVANA